MNPTVVAAIIAASVSALTLIGTIAVQIYGRRATSRELARTLAEQRSRTLNERFATAADQLGEDKPAAVRLAGVYAVAGLADDWPENRQTCVDVLCAYLRMPYEPAPGAEAPQRERLAFRASREVRDTVIRVITAHLKDGAAESWQDLNFDFTGVVFEGVGFGDVKFCGGTVSFALATFSGIVTFSGVEFSGGVVDFGGAKFPGGMVDFGGAKFSGGMVNFVHAGFSGGIVRFSEAKFSGATVRFSQARFSGGMVDFGGAVFSGGEVDFGGAVFSGGEVLFGGAKFSGATVGFGDAVFSGGMVDFVGAKFSSGTVSFPSAEFSGGRVCFNFAEFSGGKVDFTDPGDWSVPPEFLWTGTLPPGVTLPGLLGGPDP